MCFYQLLCIHVAKAVNHYSTDDLWFWGSTNYTERGGWGETTPLRDTIGAVETSLCDILIILCSVSLL